MRRRLVTLLTFLCCAVPRLALAAGCLPVASLAPPMLPAAFVLAEAPAAGTVRLTFLGHASFLIESPGGVAAVTDWNGINRPPFLPDIVTMNNAHPLHYV
jgi:hypothetical protein